MGSIWRLESWVYTWNMGETRKRDKNGKSPDVGTGIDLETVNITGTDPT